MSKTKQQLLPEGIGLQLKSEHLDAMHLMNRFMSVCRDIHQTPKQFESSMHQLYEDARKFGF